ncbi:flagellar biosynthesis protein FlhF [Pseudidiomarina homiensis]|uniref:Flagellar biosynthesis protein FlhF n=1 Tax=Pseudidiomarina homiensis TaxID=364198 RepID=A0A432Y787_9GAMM|nr:flagellar biosynthesis protein FlhF [Pseudidiomarina homiensis]RUO56751.1 flagellar biosynthesis protein FlhF [Pseudidiomarina homiensis]
MSLKRFEAQSHKEAMRLVRAAMGADAIIVTSRKTAQGFEVFALREEDLDNVVGEAPAEAASDITRQLLHDVQEMRSLLQQQMNQNPPEDKRKWSYLKLRSSGYSEALARELITLMPQHLSRSETRSEAIEAWLTQQLAARLQHPQQDWDLLQHQGVIALVGPTGVGKTTTTAKLAAHYVMQMGSESLLLVTTDSYRVGAQQQLATYAELLNVELFAMTDDSDLEVLAEKIKNKRLVLVDTVGMSQRDHRLTQRIASFSVPELGSKPRLALLLNAASQQATLHEVASVYQTIAEQLELPLRDCILTKTDEASCLGGALDTAMHFGLCLQAVSGGQQVPEDIQAPDFNALVAASLTVTAETHAFAESEGAQLSSGLSPDSYALVSHAQVIRQCVEGLAAVVPDFAEVSARIGDASTIGELPRQLPQATAWALWSAPRPFQGWGQLTPHIALDSAGLPLVDAVLQHLCDDAEVLQPNQGHLFDYLPNVTQLMALEQEQVAWLAKPSRNHHVVSQGEKNSCVKVIARNGIDLDQWTMTYRGEQRKVKLRIAAVSLQRDSEETLQLLGVKVSAGKAKGSQFERFFLVHSACTAEQTRCLVDYMLLNDELPRLTRLAWQQLESNAAITENSVEANNKRLYLSGVLAALASRVEHTQHQGGSQVRAQLMALTQRSGRIEASKLMSAMWQVIQAHEAFRVVYQQEQ